MSPYKPIARGEKLQNDSGDFRGRYYVSQSIACYEILLFHNFFHLFLEYERLKKKREEKAKKDKDDQLKKLKQDLGAGKPVAMETNSGGAQAFASMHATPFHISLGADLDSDDEGEEGSGDEFDEEEMREHESFKRFLENKKQNGQAVEKDESK